MSRPRAERHPERRRLHGDIFSVVAAFLADDNGLFVAEVEVEKVEL